MVQVRPVRKGRRSERCKITLTFSSCVGEVIKVDKLKKFIDKNVRGKTVQE